MTPLDAAIKYTRLGWSVVPIPHRSKNPGFDEWQRLRLKEGDLAAHFNGQPQNMGVLLGEPSGWLIDVDLDHARCVELADQYLPPTPAVFGRPGKPRSHRLYRVSTPVATKKHKSKSAGMLVELRSTGAQTVFPPSVHESGEPIAWETDGAEPALADPQTLLEVVARLAETVKVELGERAAPKAPKPPTTRNSTKSRSPTKSGDRFGACLDAMLKLSVIDQNDGSARLFAAACRVVEHDLSDAEGIAAVREYARQRPFPKEWTDPEIVVRIRDAEKRVRRGVIRRVPPSQGRPEVLIDTDEHRVVSETIAALRADKEIFQRGGILVRVIRDCMPADGIIRARGSAIIQLLPPANLRERITRHVMFTQINKFGVLVPAHPTGWLVSAIDARGEWEEIRPLMAVSDAPILRADGTIFQQPGYDAATGVLYEPGGETFPPVHLDVSLDDAHAAMELLEEAIVDFPFESDEHKAAWFAALLTPLARFAFAGPSPLFLVDANIRGAGKGLLVQVIAYIVLGREIPVSSYSHDSEEMRKKLTAIAIAGDRMILLDNLEGLFGNDSLDRALTSTRWQDRILGKSEQVDLPLMPAWYATGNNVQVAADTMRRIIHVRLDCPDERPEERTEFKHANLLAWVSKNRERLLCAALTILSAFLRRGARQRDLKPFGSFEGWSHVVREAVTWIGLPDPCLTRIKLAEASDTTLNALQELISALLQYDEAGTGIVVSEMAGHLYPPKRDNAPCDPASVTLRAALENIVGCPPGKAPTARQIGNKLRQFRRRVVNGMMIDADPTRGAGGMIWRIYRAGATS